MVTSSVSSVSSSVLRGVTAYLSSLNARSAVYNDDLTLLWTSEDEFFKTIDTKFISDILPIKTEQHVSIVVDKSKYAVSITPLYRSKRLVCGYVCVLRDSNEIYIMANSSAVADYTRLFLQDIQEKANRILSISKVMEGLVPEGENKEKLEGLIRDQYVQSLRIFTEASGTSTIVMPTQSTNSGFPVKCHVSMLISGLCTEASQCLVKTKRKLVKDIDMKNYYAKIDYKIFAVAFMSMFRSHLYISPLKSTIYVSTRYEDSNYFITVKSELLPEEKINFQQDLKSKQDMELARKIVTSDCGGTLTFRTENNTAVSEIKMPVDRKNRGPLLKSSNSDYLTGSYKPVHPYIDEITEKEEQAIAAIKENKDTSAGKGKKVQKRKRN